MTLALHGKSRQRQSLLAMVGLLAIIAAIAITFAALQSAFAETGAGTFGQSGQLPIAFDDAGFVDTDGTCDFGPYTADDEVWHFVVTTQGASFISLVATFEGGIQVDGVLGPQAGGDKHMYVLAPGGLDLTDVSAITDPAGATFVLSHICSGTTEPPQDTLSVSKTANATFTRTHDWSIDKWVETENEYTHDDLPKIWLSIDGLGDETATWKVEVTYEGYEDSDFAISGTITIDNPNDDPVTIDSVVDDLGLTGYEDIALDCEDSEGDIGFPYELPTLATITCTYSESFGEMPAAEGTNVVTVNWTDSAGEPAEPTGDTDDWAFGDPTTEINKVVTIKDISDLFGDVDLGTLDADDFAEGESEVLDYDKDFAWADYGADACGDERYDNTASVVGDDEAELDSASATLLVNIQCYVFETAFAKSDGGLCFIDNGFDRWGWTNTYTVGDPAETWDLWAAAGQCDTGKGTLVGTVTVSSSGGFVTVTFNVDPPYILDETHVYVGTTQYPKDKKNKPTVAPGQYTNNSPFPDDTVVHVIAHAVVGIPDPDFGP